jgi:hypothetical protein
MQLKIFDEAIFFQDRLYAYFTNKEVLVYEVEGEQGWLKEVATVNLE